jgi:hypothetical protein
MVLLLFAIMVPILRLIHLGSSIECVNKPKLLHLTVCSCTSIARKSNDDPFKRYQGCFGVALGDVPFRVESQCETVKVPQPAKHR